jgi:hypothetical protein
MESESTCNSNPLRIVEDEAELKAVSDLDKVDDNESNAELFDFSASDIEELEGDSGKRRSLLIIEEKDLTMDDVNNNNNLHRLSLQVESSDDNSLVMTNEAINRTIIRIGSNGSSVDFGEVEGSLIDKPHEAINQAVAETTATLDDGGEAIVTILGQINDIVGCLVPCLSSAKGNFRLLVSVFCFKVSLLSVLSPSLSPVTHPLDFFLFAGRSAVGSKTTSKSRSTRNSHART